KIPKENGLIIFEKPNYSQKSFKFILKYLYTGKVELRDLDSFDILQILIISSELELTPLIQFLLQHLIDNQSDYLRRNPLKFLHILLSNNNKLFSSLIDYCTEIICEN